MNVFQKILILLVLVIIITAVSLVLVIKPKEIENYATTQISLENVKGSGCEILLRNNCKDSTNSILINNFDADKDGNVNNTGTGKGDCQTTQGDNLFMLCKCYYNVNYYDDEEENCKVFCGCSHVVSVPPPITDESVPPPPYVIK